LNFRRPGNLSAAFCRWSSGLLVRGNLYKFAWAAALPHFIDIRLGEGANN
jgi:hypothetical protein